MNEEISKLSQLSRVAEPEGPMSVYDRMSDPLKAIEALGEVFHQSEMFGCSKASQGKVLALACLMRKQDPFELMAQNMIVMGKLTRKYECMLADLRNRGGDFHWIDDGQDCRKATIEITWRGQVNRFTYTMEDAKRAGLVKDGSGWKKYPGNMLRSKAARNGLRAYAPEIGDGLLTPDEAMEIYVPSSSVAPESFPEPENLTWSSSPVGPIAPVDNQEAKTKTKAKAKAEPVPVPEPVPEPAPEPEPEPESELASKPRVSLDGVLLASQQQHERLISLGKALGLTTVQVGENVCAAIDGLEDPLELTSEQADMLIDSCEQNIAARSESGN